MIQLICPVCKYSITCNKEGTDNYVHCTNCNVKIRLGKKLSPRRKMQTSPKTGCVILDYQQTKSYLHKCLELEITLYEIEQIENKIQERITFYKNRTAVEAHRQDSNPLKWIATVAAIAAIYPSFSIAGKAFGGVINSNSDDYFVIALLILFFAVAAFLCVFGVCETIAYIIGSIPSLLYSNYQDKKIEEYNKKERKRVHNENDKALKLLNENLDKLQSVWHEARTKLNEFYNLNVLTETYRNLIAVSSLTEYYDNGRCDVLEQTGQKKSGYNLFEKELRMNLIITRIEDILKRLEDIRNNQNLLYHCLSRSNEKIDKMNSNIEALTSRMQSVQAQVMVNNYYQEKTARNLEYIKWLNDPYKW